MQMRLYQTQTELAQAKNSSLKVDETWEQRFNTEAVAASQHHSRASSAERENSMLHNSFKVGHGQYDESQKNLAESQRKLAEADRRNEELQRQLQQLQQKAVMPATSYGL